MRRTVHAGLACLLGCALAAQQEQPTGTPDVTFEQLEKEYGAARQAHFATYRELSDEEKESFDFYVPQKQFMARFEALAEKHAGTDQAVPPLTWLVGSITQVDAAKAEAAARTLVDAHAASGEILAALPAIGRLGSTIGREQAHTMLTAILEQNRTPAIQDAARFHRASIFLGYRPHGTEEQQADALADLDHVAASATADERLRERAKGKAHETRTLSVGCVAPDIEGRDLDGVEFKLSDYRGKIVFLDFWGDW